MWTSTWSVTSFQDRQHARETNNLRTGADDGQDFELGSHSLTFNEISVGPLRIEDFAGPEQREHIAGPVFSIEWV